MQKIGGGRDGGGGGGGKLIDLTVFVDMPSDVLQGQSHENNSNSIVSSCIVRASLQEKPCASGVICKIFPSISGKNVLGILF